MFDPKSVAQAYLETWNEPDEDRRRALLSQHWTATATYADPLMRAEGTQQIAGLVGAVQQRFPGFRFRPSGTRTATATTSGCRGRSVRPQASRRSRAATS